MNALHLGDARNIDDIAWGDAVSEGGVEVGAAGQDLAAMRGQGMDRFFKRPRLEIQVSRSPGANGLSSRLDSALLSIVIRVIPVCTGRPRKVDVCDRESVQHSCDGGRHQISHGSCQHGAQAETREISAAVGREGADAPDLNADRTEVCEAAERKGRDREGPGIEHASLWPQHGKGYEFVEYHARAEQIPDGATLQLGIGNLPNAVAMHLADRKGLGIHSELFSHAFVRLI